ATHILTQKPGFCKAKPKLSKGYLTKIAKLSKIYFDIITRSSEGYLGFSLISHRLWLLISIKYENAVLQLVNPFTI
ncbi:MAG: hypothetical protein KAH14_06020, partial [Clostridiales bacterium]|nr:hypothetical protein [Clostridiales bacterium]